MSYRYYRYICLYIIYKYICFYINIHINMCTCVYYMQINMHMIHVVYKYVLVYNTQFY